MSDILNYNDLLKTIARYENIDVAQFMNYVIPYYYKHNIAIGRKGDFITAPEISQLYGEIIAIHIANHILIHDVMEFNLIEMGSGRGTLIYDIIRTLQKLKDIKGKLHKVFIYDFSEQMRQKQREKLAPYLDMVTWIEDFEDIDKTRTNILIANEFFDCLPLRQFIKTELGLREVKLRFIDTEKLQLEKYLEASRIILPFNIKMGEVYELPTTYDQYANIIVHALKMPHSMGLIIDYGYISPIGKSTLQAIYKHKKVDPFKHIGMADITALVNFEQLKKKFEEREFYTKITTQKKFLISNGIEVRAALFKKLLGIDYQDQVDRLCNEGKMGELFKVLQVFRRAGPAST